AADAAGDIYVAEIAGSSDFPVTPDALRKTWWMPFVSILSADGRSLLHSTFLNLDDISGIAIDSHGRVVVVGSGDPDFIAGTGAFDTQSMAVVARLAPNLDKVDYVTGIPSTSLAAAVALDSNDEAYITGQRQAFPPGFAAKLDASGRRLWATDFGPAANYITPFSTISVDVSGNAYVVGTALNGDFPVTPGAFSWVRPGPEGTFAVKLRSDTGAIVYSTVIGAVGTPTSAAVDSSGDLLITGSGVPPTFPSTSNSQHPCFSAGGSGFVYIELSPDATKELNGGVLPLSA